VRAGALRPATADDWHAIERLLNEAGLPVAGAREHLSGFVVVEWQGSIAACGVLERYERAALLRSVVVSPSLRGTGLGKRLVHELVEVARSEGAAAILLLTTTASEWFRASAFARPAARRPPRRCCGRRSFVVPARRARSSDDWI